MNNPLISMSVNLWEKKNIPLYDEEKGQNPEMEAFLIDSDKPLGAIIIFPGGGYHHLSLENEGSKIAQFYNSHGFNAFKKDDKRTRLCFSLVFAIVTAPYTFLIPISWMY